MPADGGGPPVRLSVLVASYKMRRALPRTLHTLTTDYQIQIPPRQYEVLVGENPSDEMMNPADVEAFGPQFRYVSAPRPNISPAPLINQLAREARGQALLILVDGARMLSPGVLRSVLEAQASRKKFVAAFHGFHLGSDLQEVAVREGRYSEAIEDELLASVDWRRNGYLLHRISTFAASSTNGWFGGMAESNCIALPTDSFREMGGMDERFRSSGGGLVNLEFYERAHQMPGHIHYHVLGEGTFHQIHGGASTGADEDPFEIFRTEYEELKGKAWSRPPKRSYRYLGTMPPAAWDKLEYSTAKLRRPAAQRAQLAGLIAEADEGAGTSLGTELRRNETVIVFGMHRSGTSTMAQLFAKRGYEIPGPELGGNEFNVDGHFEPREMVKINDAIFRRFAMSWHNASALPENWMLDEDVVRIEPLLRSYLQQSEVWVEGTSPQATRRFVVKDPRLCRTWPVWSSVLNGDGGPSAKAVIMTRDPDEVAASLRARNGISMEHGRLIWARYNIELMRYCADLDPFVVDYHDLTDAPDDTINNAFEAIGHPVDSVERAVLAGLIKKRDDRPATGGAVDTIRTAYDDYRNGRSFFEAMQSLAADMDVIDRIAGPYLNALERGDVLVERGRVTVARDSAPEGKT